MEMYKNMHKSQNMKLSHQKKLGWVWLENLLLNARVLVQVPHFEDIFFYSFNTISSIFIQMRKFVFKNKQK